MINSRSPTSPRDCENLLNHPSIFSKVCAHELAARRSKAQSKELNGDLDDALDLWRSVNDDAPGDPQSLLKQIALLERLGQREEAVNLITSALEKDQDTARPNLSHFYRLRLKEWAIDLDAYEHRQMTDKRSAYLSLADQSLNRPNWRRLAIKAYAVNTETPYELRALIMKLLSSSTITSLEMKEQLSQAADQWPKSTPISYLLARVHYRTDELKRADELLEKALSFGLPHHSLTYESLKLRAQLAFQRKSYQQAERAYQELAPRQDLHILNGERDELMIWVRRAQFFGRFSTTLLETTNP